MKKYLLIMCDDRIVSKVKSMIHNINILNLGFGEVKIIDEHESESEYVAIPKRKDEKDAVENRKG